MIVKSRMSWMKAIVVVVVLMGVWSSVQCDRWEWDEFPVQSSKAVIAQISAGLKAYRSDFDAFPPSHREGGEGGGERVCRLLTGYTSDEPRANPDNTPGLGPAFKDDDGKQGFGFRLAAKGRVFGPYGRTEELNTSGLRGTKFVDAHNQPVLYYLFDKKLGTYRSEDNPDGPKDINAYARTADGNLYRTDYLLLSAGPDGEWSDNAGDDGSDDITNFNEW